MTTDVRQLMLYATPQHRCSYLPDRQAVTAFVDPNIELTQDIYDQLILAGFRRSGTHIYMPYCGDCNECISLRIIMEDFKLSRSFKRILKRNNDIQVKAVPQENIDKDKHYELYSDYIRGRHYNGDMFPPNREQFEKFLFSEWCEVLFLEYWLDGKLIGAATTDILSTGLSALYTYFLPELDKRSLGTFSILKQAEYCRYYQLPYLYLGYYVKGSPKMTYKVRFQPLQAYLNGKWDQLL